VAGPGPSPPINGGSGRSNHCRDSPMQKFTKLLSCNSQDGHTVISFLSEDASRYLVRGPPKTAARKAPTQVSEVPVETTIIDVIEEPLPGVVVVTEYESVRTATPISPDGKPGSGQGTGRGTKEQ
jgi:hypothetical protein